MRRPYLKKYGRVSKFTIWIVDGNYVRTNIDEEFTNFGQHWRFLFIPKNEFWVDKEHKEGEERYYIDHMLVENRLMREGKSFAEASDAAELIEKRERSKSDLLKRNIKKISLRKIVIDKIHKTLFKKNLNGLHVWIVNGELVRDLLFVNFTEGGHDKVYHFIPKNEIWLDDDVQIKERKFILLHELYERRLMCTGWPYRSTKKNPLSAHDAASDIEYFYRHHPRLLNKRLVEELKNNS